MFRRAKELKRESWNEAIETDYSIWIRITDKFPV